MIDYPPPDFDIMSGTIAIGTATLAFLIYQFVFTSGKLYDWLRDSFGDEGAAIRKVLYNRLLGGVLYGLIPFLIILFVFRRPLNLYGFSGDYLVKSFLWWIPVAVFLVLVTWLGAKSEKNLEMYPQIRVSEWNRGLLLVSATSWITYLVGYEFMFRGFLLFSCLESFGYWPAIIINICLYSLFHIHKGPREAFGSLLFGFLLCYLTLHLGSFWFAIFVHVTMALSNEWFSLGFQPEMKIIKSKGTK
jgi:membrane protease YdiL (CAAX protease family)